ncbi:LA_3696 family protein [Candidatus Magnetobacterium casense]|uniref:DUF1640 domain-containing protein n=1 Tax=Candidatus Magnetobacterium casense TaxID=1455061 RepID=A0ABS6RV17_9BACT|nr:hypothetical protein [Candidatus Magnetobacterium casensis]MBV6340195.1 hypothetical protein [Candidatus Magnetobacterium casensis]
MSVITIPEVLRRKLGDDGVEALVKVVNEVDSDSRRDSATKEDILKLELKLELKIESTRSNLELKIESTRSDLELKIESIKSDLELKIESTKSDLLKWTFIFWAGQLVAIYAMFKTFIK